MLGEILNRVAPVAQDAGIAVDKGNLAQAGASVPEAVVVGDRPGLRAEVAHIQRLLALTADDHRQLEFLTLELERGFFGHLGRAKANG